MIYLRAIKALTTCLLIGRFCPINLLIDLRGFEKSSCTSRTIIRTNLYIYALIFYIIINRFFSPFTSTYSSFRVSTVSSSTQLIYAFNFKIINNNNIIILISEWTSFKIFLFLVKKNRSPFYLFTVILAISSKLVIINKNKC